ncbi:hypothetical protein NM688_g4048 [Phlebia brevispora]|uniref:Uncharacterized protein n=1 Tax=Phlebia brevispora TaxID=194682 RepID=A0ACC1T3Z8_9APHY|nr:hypothetical protein NM688_g4048 [Phlebia brevispora]
MHSFSLFILLSSICILIAVAEAVNWNTLNPGNPEYIYKIQPASLNTRLDHVCEPLAELPCIHEIWAVLDLDNEEWRAFSKFTLRISWPANYPADFSIQTFSPAELRQQLGRGDDTVTYLNGHRKTRSRYARIRAVDTGVRNPLSQSTPQTDVPFALRLEPLYLGVIPASVMPTLAFLLPLVAFVAFVMVPRIHRLIASVAMDAKEELAKAHAENKND